MGKRKEEEETLEDDTKAQLLPVQRSRSKKRRDEKAEAPENNVVLPPERTQRKSRKRKQEEDKVPEVNNTAALLENVDPMQRRIPRKRKREADESLEDPLPISLVTQDDREGKNPCFNRKKPPAAANTAASGSSPWQCIKCSYRNEANKKRCVKCHGWKGGRRPQKKAQRGGGSR